MTVLVQDATRGELRNSNNGELKSSHGGLLGNSKPQGLHRALTLPISLYLNRAFRKPSASFIQMTVPLVFAAGVSRKRRLRVYCLKPTDLGLLEGFKKRRTRSAQ